jgi:SAM-dependent methyltransferase
MTIEVFKANSETWDRLAKAGDKWTIPVGPDEISRARRGEWSVVLTPVKPVPRSWFGELKGARVLCLASGGGQQTPILAAAGATVTVLDNSPEQLARDREVAEREKLTVFCELGTMNDLSRFADDSFDLAFHPVANLFIPEIRPVWRETFRVLRPEGRLLSGFANPIIFLFDEDAEEREELIVRNSLPYSDLNSYSAEELRRRVEAGHPIEFGHTLEDQIGGQLEAGFVLAGFYEDAQPGRTLNEYSPLFIATLALKPPIGARNPPLPTSR